jgi:glycosyltransferase involved in cell wall biosynthesis
VKVAYVSPFPPERSGIADYSALLLPALQRRADVSPVRRNSRRLPSGVDVAVYHIGNNADAHGWIFELMRRNANRVPALVVLHEFVLHHLVGGMTLGRGDSEAYRAALQADAGLVGRLLGHAVVDGLIPPLWETRAQDFPLATPVLDLTDLAVAHSHHVEQRIRSTSFDGPVRRIPMPIWSDPPTSPDGEIAQLGAGVVFGSVGYLNPSKRIPQLIGAFAQLSRTRSDAVLVLAGAVSPGLELESLLARNRLEHGRDVILIDHVPEEHLWALLSAFDVCISLRAPTMGETSAMALRALAVGRPLVVNDLGWFAELPDEVAEKVKVDEREIDVLAAALEALAADPDRRAEMSAAARAYVRREHDPEHSADLYLAAIEEAAGGAAVEDAVLDEVAQAALDVGVQPSGHELREVGRAAREVGLGR